ncbi:Por secretion system C-terminal sorting domain-containing protein [Filimonas lacunae]|uniref:Por secretion system C-terminal sorting domain-containing protein n=1 Tax=Filimonas lacunae TaxID=477680 RepID=A0A173MDQ6_9BACT|nr:MBG domain-containing protein [Filimonas lacunae]BAV05660.1 fibronectin type III domain protein [Filimonas lacunae]SIT29007.1 Por secretion system C-terminal sorting domain-containing protein [Filimonas lacunae]
MKKLILQFCFLGLFFIAGKSQTLTEVILPQYMYGNGTTGGSIITFAFRAKISGLTASSTYRYNNLAVLVADDQTKTGTGYSQVAKETANFNRNVTTAALTGSNTGTFVSDANGEYTGWFILEPYGVKFTAGNEVLMQVNLGAAGGGQSITKRLYSSNTVKVINWGSSAANNGTAIRSVAKAGVAKNFVMLYDTDTATVNVRPISSAVIESDGLDISTQTLASAFASFYKTDVDAKDKAWGTLIPNNLANGIRKIIRYNFDGSQAGFNTSATGSWPASATTTVSTVNATGGITDVIVLDGDQVTLDAPVKTKAELAFPATFPAEVYTTATDFSAGVTSKSLVTIAYSSSNETVATIDAAGLIHIVGAGSVTIKAVQAEDATYAADSAEVSLLVTVPKTVPTLVFPDAFPATVIVSAADFNAGVTSNSPVAITYTSSNAAAATIDANGLIHIVGLGTTVITASQESDATYTEATATKTLTVVDKPVPTTSFLPFSTKIYGDVPFDVTATASSGATVIYTTDNPSVAQIVNNQVTVTGAGTATITATFPATSSYSQASTSQVLTVQKKALSIVADNITKKQGDANPALTVTYIGLVNGDTYATALQTPVQVSTSVTTTSPAGIYPISVNGGIAANYTLTLVPGTLTVEAVFKENVISFPALSMKVYGSADVEAGATASSGLAVTYTSSNTNVVVISGTKIHIVGAGAATITASQAGNSTYAAASPVTQTVTVNKALLTVSTIDTSKTQGVVNPDFILTFSGFVYSDNASSLTTLPVAVTSATTSSPAGVYPVVVSGGIADNYDFLYINGKFTIYPASGKTNDEVVGYCDAPGQLKISVLSKSATRAAIQLYDASGKKVVDLTVQLSAGFNVYHVDVSRLAAGVYPLRVVGNDLLLKYKAVIR